MASAQDVLNIMRSKLGQGGRESQEYMGIGNQAWCDAFQSLCLAQTGDPNLAKIKSAWCDTNITNYKNGSWGMYVDRMAEIRPGDQVFYDWGDGGPSDHVGMVETVGSNGSFTTIEGNWGNRVSRVPRDRRQVICFGRPAYSGASPAPTPPAYGGSILTLQRNLNTILGPPKIAEDGEPGPRTTQRVRDFQRFVNDIHKLGGGKGNVLVEDGDPGPQTLASINWWLNAKKPVPKKPLVPSGNPTMGPRKRNNTDRVRALQACLNYSNNCKLATDGVYGERTTMAVKLFQDFWHLDGDGQYGPRTESVMSYRIALMK